VPMTRKKIAGPGFRGLLSTRQGALALAMLCALAATVILVFALGSYRKSVNTTVKQDTVLVATSLIPKGSSGDVIAAQQRFKATPVLAAQVSVGALSDASLVAGKVAVKDILPGQQVTAADFSATAESGYVAKLAPSQRAVSISLDSSHGLGGVVQAGDHVDVYGSYTAAPGTKTGANIALVAADALVLAAPGAVGGPSSTVLAVSIDQASRVAFTSDNAKLWLLLRPDNATRPTLDLTDLESILAGRGHNLSAVPLTTYSTGAQP
jgi:Flp pilus assembly protein CpaB